MTTLSAADAKLARKIDAQVNAALMAINDLRKATDQLDSLLYQVLYNDNNLDIDARATYRATGIGINEIASLQVALETLKGELPHGA